MSTLNQRLYFSVYSSFKFKNIFNIISTYIVNVESTLNQHTNHISVIPGHTTKVIITFLEKKLQRPIKKVLITTSIKHHIRLRNRAYRKAKRTNTTHHWAKFRAHRNKVIGKINDSKSKCNENIANNLKSDTLSSKDWWLTLKIIISPNSSNSSPPLDKDGQIITYDLDKADTLNDYFRDQTLNNDSNEAVPDVIQYNVLHELRSLILTPAEIEVILKSLPTRKAAGPDCISNQIFREQAVKLSYPLCSLFNQSLQTRTFPDSWKLSNVSSIPKTRDRLSVSNY